VGMLLALTREQRHQAILAARELAIEGSAT